MNGSTWYKKPVSTPCQLAPLPPPPHIPSKCPTWESRLYNPFKEVPHPSLLPLDFLPPSQLIPTGCPSFHPTATGCPSSHPTPTGCPSSHPTPSGRPSSHPIPTGCPSSHPTPLDVLHPSPPTPTLHLCTSRTKQIRSVHNPMPEKVDTAASPSYVISIYDGRLTHLQFSMFDHCFDRPHL